MGRVGNEGDCARPVGTAQTWPSVAGHGRAKDSSAQINYPGLSDSRSEWSSGEKAGGCGRQHGAGGCASANPEVSFRSSLLTFGQLSTLLTR